MFLETEIKGTKYRANAAAAFDISIPVSRGGQGVEAFYIPKARMEPLRAGGFVGSVEEGGACNCENIQLNAHGNGTHTEGVGHVSREHHFVQVPSPALMPVRLVSVFPEIQPDGDRLVKMGQIQVSVMDMPALIIRTLPNTDTKKQTIYSGTNPTYLDPALTKQLREAGVQHLLVDLPSVDREEDGGLLLAHKNWWNYPEEPRTASTITEFVYIPDNISDGLYLLNLLIPAIETDAVPSRPLLYPLEQI